MNWKLQYYERGTECRNLRHVASYESVLSQFEFFHTFPIFYIHFLLYVFPEYYFTIFSWCDQEKRQVEIHWCFDEYELNVNKPKWIVFTDFFYCTVARWWTTSMLFSRWTRQLRDWRTEQPRRQLCSTGTTRPALIKILFSFRNMKITTLSPTPQELAWCFCSIAHVQSLIA